MSKGSRRVALVAGFACLMVSLPVGAAAASGISITVTKWDRNTETGTIVYDVTLNGTCSASRCYWALDAFYADGTAEVFQGGIAVGSVYGDSAVPTPFTKRLTKTLEGSAAREITHLKASMELSTGAWIRSGLYPVSTPYPDPWVTLMVTRWRLDPATGYVEYDLTMKGRGLGQRLGPCSDLRCNWGIEAYSTTETGRRLVHVLYSSSNVGDRMWTVDHRVTTSSLRPNNVTHLRAFVRPHSCAAPCAYQSVEAWQGVSNYTYKNHDLAGSATGLTPVLAANGTFFCTHFLLQGGTHYARSTLTDQFLACEAAVAAGTGYTYYAVGQAIVDAGGGPTLDRVSEDSRKPFPKPTETAIPIPPPEWEEETGCNQEIPEWSVEVVAGHISDKHGYTKAPVERISYWGYGVPWEELVYPYAMRFKAYPGTNPDTCIRVIDYHAPVGYRPIFEAVSGQPAFELTTTYTVVTDRENGSLATAFPGYPGDA